MRTTNSMVYVGYGLLLEEDTNGTIFVSSPDIPELTTFGVDVDASITGGLNAIREAIAARIAGGKRIPDMKDVTWRAAAEAEKVKQKTGGSPLDMPRPEDMRSLSYSLDNMKHKLRDSCISETSTGYICDLCGGEANDPYTLQFIHAGDCIITALELTSLKLDMIAAWGIHRKKVEARNG